MLTILLALYAAWITLAWVRLIIRHAHLMRRHWLAQQPRQQSARVLELGSGCRLVTDYVWVGDGQVVPTQMLVSPAGHSWHTFQGAHN